MEIRDKAAAKLKEITSKKIVHFTQRGNKAILTALKIAKMTGRKKVIIQDQGGWITYLQYPEKLKMELIKVKTDYGVILPDELTKVLDSDSVLLINSLSGYFAEQPMQLVSAVCKQKGAMLINDASGSVGTENAKVGDIIIGSFGEGEPIGIEYGGFIAFDNLDFYNEAIFSDIIFDTSKYELLLLEIESLNERLRYFEKKDSKIKSDLSSMKILHREKRGINVVIAFDNSFERERIINYCDEHKYQYTECPRYIRANSDAISIEIKRLK